MTFKEYPSGPAVVDGMLKGEVDIAATSEYVFVGKTLNKEKISIISTIVRVNFIYLAGRKDRGIENFTDLKGKRIGLTLGTILEFYLGRFLELHGMSMRDVILVNVEQTKLEDAITKGEVDAVIAKDTIVNQIKQGVNDVVAWPAQENQPAFGVVSGRTDWITQHPEMVKHFLKALSQAEEYMINHQAEAKSIVQRRLNADGTHIATIWPNYQFSLSLDFSLIIALNDEARWMISNNLTTEKTVPDFKDYIYLDGLKAVKPDAVNIIR